MTIRQYLRLRSDRHATAAFAFLLLVGASAAFLPRILAIRIAIAVVIIAVVWGAVGPVRAPSPRCPHCNIQIDAEMPGKPQA
jgi:hypothetical protein